MKEGKNLRAAEFLAKNLALMIAKNDHHKHAILVPVPSSKRGQKNHANVLAMKVSGYLGLPVKDCLEWVNKQSSHKSSSKAERFKARMRVADLTFDWCNKNIILIDDVITTGATVRAAFLAFQSPKVFCCYALCCKSLS